MDDDDTVRLTGLGGDRLPYCHGDTYSAWLCAIRSVPEDSYPTVAGACRPCCPLGGSASLPYKHETGHAR